MGLKSDYNIEIIHINDEANKAFKEKYIDAIVKKAQIIKIKIDKNKFAENEEHLGEIVEKIDSQLYGLF